MRFLIYLPLALFLVLPACGDDAPALPDSGGGVDSGGGLDSGGTDAGGGTDGGGMDGSADDGGSGDDAGGESDAAAADDASTADAGPPEPGKCDMTMCTATCFRPIFCVTVCGGPRQSCGCCACEAPSFDDIACSTM